MVRSLSAPSLAVALCLSAALAQAKIVDEGKLAQYCREEAVAKLNPTKELMLLPVEQSRGEFFVYGQTDEPNPSLFECRFDKSRKFLGIKVTPAAASGAAAPANPAVERCLGMMGPGSQVEQVSPLKPGFHEVIMRNGNRRVACTASETGVGVEDWVEMKP